MAEWQKNKYDKNIRIETSGRGRLVDDTNDAQITVNPIYVGTVTNGGGWPSTRPSGDALSDGDYVKVNPGATLPFTLYSGGNAVTFYTVGDQAVWDEANSCWKYDPSSPRSTAGVTLADAAAESLTSTDYVQQDANKTFKYWIEWLIEEIKKAGYSFDFTATDVDSVRSLHYVLYDKTGAVISSKDFNDFLLKTRQVAGIDLVDNITVTELEGALKEEPVTYKNKTISADDNSISNLEVDNFKDTAITESSEMATSTNWTDQQIPTTKAVRSVTGSDFELNYYSSGYTGTNNPYLEFKMKNGEGAVIANHTVEIDNPIDSIVYNENTSTDNSLTITFDNGTTSDLVLTNVVITDHTQTLTNKTIDADNNTISNLEVDNFKVNTAGSATAGVIVTEIASSEDDTMLPTAKAVYDYATYGLDSEVVVEPDVSNKVTIKLQDKDGNNRDTTDILIPSDIEEVSALPVTGQRTDRLYYVTGTASLNWYFGGSWYCLSDTNGVIQVTTLPDATTAKQDAIYHEINTNSLNWTNGTAWIDISSYVDGDRGLSRVGTKIGHANSITADTTNTANPVALKYDEYGHITGATKLWTVTNAFTPVGSTDTFQMNVTACESGSPVYYKKDVVFTDGLKLARTDDGGSGTESDPYVQTTTVSHSNSAITADTDQKLRQFSVDSYGHVTGYTDVTSIAAADRGLSIVSNSVGHSNTAITAVTTNGLYKLKFDAYGHITGYETYTPAVQGADRGLSVSSYKVGHSNTAITAQTTQNLQSIKYDAYGHITAGTAITTGRDINISSNVLGHSNSVTAQTTQNLQSIKYDAYGHITAGTAITTGRDINISSNVLGHSNSTTARTTLAAYKVKIDEYGHVTSSTALTSETWTFTLSSGSTVTKTVWVG